MEEEEFGRPTVNWRERLLCLLIGLFAGTAAAVIILAANQQAQPTALLIEPPPPLPTATLMPAPSATATAAPIQVYVSGAVLESGVYALPAGARLGEAIAAAGGLAMDAEAAQINLAQPLRDGDQVHVPTVEEVAAVPPLVQTAVPVVEPAGNGNSAPAPGRININTADVALLQTLPGVGPSTAENIVSFREANGPFATIEAIMDVPGIGPAKFSGFADLITVDG